MQWQQHMPQEAAAGIAGPPFICGGAESREGGILNRHEAQPGSVQTEERSVT